jgi:hypothetical protein
VLSGLLLDTNILSELRKESHCDVGVRNWVEGTAAEDLFVSVQIRRQLNGYRL